MSDTEFSWESNPRANRLVLAFHPKAVLEWCRDADEALGAFVVRACRASRASRAVAGELEAQNHRHDNRKRSPPDNALQW